PPRMSEGRRVVVDAVDARRYAGVEVVRVEPVAGAKVEDLCSLPHGLAGKGPAFDPERNPELAPAVQIRAVVEPLRRCRPKPSSMRVVAVVGREIPLGGAHHRLEEDEAADQ